MHMAVLQLLLGVFAGAMLAIAAAMLRAPKAVARWVGVMFNVTSAAYAFKLWDNTAHLLPPPAALLLGVFAMSAIGWFWLLVLALFGEFNRFRPAMYAAPVIVVLPTLARIGSPDALDLPLLAISIVVQVSLIGHALMTILRSWKDDLVESRRRMRGPLLVAVTLYLLSLNAMDVIAVLRDVPVWYPMTNGVVLCLIAAAASLVFLDPRADLFGPATDARRAAARPVGNGETPQIDRAARADLDRLQALMTREEVWREEGLTISSLAVRMQMPEAHLRRLINDRLGHRNFPSFVNAHRIDAAKTRLADPEQARTSVSAIAFDIGFASLGPFNRAFREATGVSPTEWRRKALADDSPIPEMA